MGENYLVTGYHGENHVTAENQRGINASIFGAGRFVLPVGKEFMAEYIGNNTVRMYDGYLLDNGAVAGIPAGQYIDLLIPEAGQGMKRNDLIIFRYKKDTSTLIESGTFEVVKGEETSGTPADPTLNGSNLLTNPDATFDRMPLWSVPVSGSVISAPVQKFDVTRNLKTIDNAIDAVSTDGGVSYTADLPLIRKPYVGMSFKIIPNTNAQNAEPKLNVNGWGSKEINRLLTDGQVVSNYSAGGPWIRKGHPYLVTWNGDVWVSDITVADANRLYGDVPVESGGTGGGSARQARENLGFVSFSLVWRNDRPGTAFPGTTTSLPTDDFEAFIVRARYGTGRSQGVTVIIPADSSGRLVAVGREGKNEAIDRVVTINSLGGEITFSDATVDGVANNNYMIPTHVYGIAGIKEHEAMYRY